jgi:hypothetical protein
MPYVAVQQLLDEVKAWGFHACDKETYLADLSDEAIEVVAEHLPQKNPPLSVLVQHEWEETGAPGVSPGQAPSDRGRQRPPRPGCLIPCHPVSPVSLPGRAEPCCCYTFYYSA